MPHFAWLDDKPAVMWRMLRAPGGFPCRIDRIGAGADEWAALHQRTAAWSPFNYQLSVRLIRNGVTVGAEGGQRFASTRTASSRRHRSRIAHGSSSRRSASESVARRVPPDRPVPPRP
jgi:hypothetical protein